HRVGLAAVPAVPQPREEEGLAALLAEPERHLAARGGAPLVIAVDRHHAAAAAQQIAEHRPLGERLGAGIDRPPRGRRVLGPRRQQAPLELFEAQLARAVRLADDPVRQARADVVARRELVAPHDGVLEHRLDALLAAEPPVSSAHECGAYSALCSTSPFTRAPSRRTGRRPAWVRWSSSAAQEEITSA